MSDSVKTIKELTRKYQAEAKSLGYSTMVIHHKVLTLSGEDKHEVQVGRHVQVTDMEDEFRNDTDINAAIEYSKIDHVERVSRMIDTTLRSCWETIAPQAAHEVIAELALEKIIEGIKESGIEEIAIMETMNRLFGEKDSLKGVAIKGACGMLVTATQVLEQKLKDL